MKLVVMGSQMAFEELRSSNPAAEWVMVDEANEFMQHPDAVGFFDLNENACTNEHPSTSKPLFLNSVVHPIDPQKKAIRINGWNGFLKNERWEINGNLGERELGVLNFLKKQTVPCGDEPGFISARVIAMIINEAFFAEEQEVSTRSEIDTAMKLGTNYPKGPFEWAEEIGIKNVYALLKKLSITDSRYQPSLSLSNLAID
jgi:3-hydroxybutyryl-CoA dehydrogenase